MTDRLGYAQGAGTGSRSGEDQEARQRRLQELVRLARQGLYQPDLEALAERLLDKEPGLFGADGLRAAEHPAGQPESPQRRRTTD